MMPNARRQGNDSGAALALVLGALVLSATITTALVDHARVTMHDVTSRSEVERRRGALDGAIRAAATTAGCRASRWLINGNEIAVTCSVDSGSSEYESYEAVLAGHSGRVVVVVRRDERGAIVEASWKSALDE
jgi:hypothetical protein